MNWSRPRRIVVLLTIATLVPMGVLTWLTVRLLVQDADVERQRQRDALEVTAGRVALDVERRLQEIDERLAQGEGVRLAADGPVVASGPALLYGPDLPVGALSPPAPASFRSAEALEYRQRNMPGAAAAYRTLADSAEPAVRAAALLALGRVLRAQDDREGALAAYAELEALDAVAVAGVPAALQGVYARGRLLESLDDRPALATAAADLGAHLRRGGWAIDRATFDEYRDAVLRWGGSAPDPTAVARTEAIIDVWTGSRRGELSAAGRQLSTHQGVTLLVMWTSGSNEPVATVMAPAEVEAWLGPAWTGQPVAVSGSGVEGEALFGERAAAGLTLLPSETRLPFVLHVAGRDDGQGTVDWRRQAVLPAALALAFILMGAAAVGLYRTTTRELTLAREQADFVSAVSHEFRTPLTSMRHITDLLARRVTIDDERRARYYSLLADETERLHRMVETLLSFGRIEAGAHAWQFERASSGAIVEQVVSGFRREPLARDRDVTVDVEAGLPDVQADREALARAVWNLLENAAKYSEHGRPILVFARRTDRGVAIAVRDRGVGIDPAERERIFRKFVRGADAGRSGARGVGIGLALVKTIVEAHRGTIGVESERGAGSTFTIELPASDAASAAASEPTPDTPRRSEVRP